jgi:glycosyltransferase involved in cell wall biosynthesis
MNEQTRDNLKKGGQRVLWISHSSGLFGAEKVLAEGIIALKDLGHEVILSLPNHGPLEAWCINEATHIVITPTPWWVRNYRLSIKRMVILAGQIIRSSWAFIRLIKKHKPDLVITNTITIPAGALASRFTGVKHIWYIHEFGWEDHKLRYYFGERLSHRVISMWSRRVIVNSLATKSKYDKSIPARKVGLLYYAVTPDGYLFNRDTKTTFTSESPMGVIIVGLVAENKGQMEAVRAIELLVKEKGYYIRLTLLGAINNQYSRHVSGYVDNNELSGVVSILSFTKDPWPIIASHDVSLNCSVCEAFGRITVESMKMGIPVIASNSGANPELVSHGETGLLYEQGNVKSLAEKLEYFYLNPEKIWSIGHNAFMWASNRFNMKRFARDLEHELLGDHSNKMSGGLS